MTNIGGSYEIGGTTPDAGVNFPDLESAAFEGSRVRVKKWLLHRATRLYANHNNLLLTLKYYENDLKKGMTSEQELLWYGSDIRRIREDGEDAKLTFHIDLSPPLSEEEISGMEEFDAFKNAARTLDRRVYLNVNTIGRVTVGIYLRKPFEEPEEDSGK